MNLIQGLEEELNAIQRRINQLIALEEKRDEFYDNHQHAQNKIERTFDRNISKYKTKC